MKKYFTIREKSTDELIAVLVLDNMTKNMRKKILKDTEHFYYTKMLNPGLMRLYIYCVENELGMLTIKNGKLLGINIDEHDKIYQYENELNELLYKSSKNAQK